MIALLINILILLIIFGILYWVITLLPLPSPFAPIATAVLAVILLLILVVWLLPAGGLWHEPLR